MGTYSKMAVFLRSVLKKPHVKPLLWNCTTYGLLYGGAEFTQQSKAKYYDKDIKQYDMPKVGRFWVLGTFAFPPILYAWYKILESRPWLLGTSPQAVIGKVLIDQAVSAPIVLFLFFTGMSLMEGKEDIFKEFKEKFKSTYMVSDSPLIIIVSRVSASSCLVLHDWLYFLVKKSQMYFRYSYIIILIFFYDTFK